MLNSGYDQTERFEHMSAPKVTTPQFESHLRNIRGTFAAEGMTISKATQNSLERIASGQASYQQVLRELHAKYEKRG